MSNEDELEDELPPNAPPEERAALRRTRKIAQLLDEAIAVPGTDYRIGLDPILGVLPVSGDLVTGVIGLYIAAEAARAGAPRTVIGRMIANVLADVVVGSIPVVGSLFDAVWKANVRNVDLFEDYVAEAH